MRKGSKASWLLGQKKHCKTDRQTGRQTGRQADRQAGKQAGRQTDRQTDRQTGRQAGRQAGRQERFLSRAQRPPSGGEAHLPHLCLGVREGLGRDTAGDASAR